MSDLSYVTALSNQAGFLYIYVFVFPNCCHQDMLWPHFHSGCLDPLQLPCTRLKNQPCRSHQSGKCVQAHRHGLKTS